jgi:hypothetical protein
MNSLKLVALDRDDLEIVSAHLQDALVKATDIRWRPSERRLVIGLCRFDWEAAHTETPTYRRRYAALRFELALSCKALNVDTAEDADLNLLAVTFTEGDPPSGVVTLTFSGGGVLRVEVECLEAELVDLSEAWATVGCPDHSKVALNEG